MPLGLPEMPAGPTARVPASGRSQARTDTSVAPQRRTWQGQPGRTGDILLRSDARLCLLVAGVFAMSVVAVPPAMAQNVSATTEPSLTLLLTAPDVRSFTERALDDLRTAVTDPAWSEDLLVPSARSPAEILADALTPPGALLIAASPADATAVHKLNVVFASAEYATLVGNLRTYWRTPTGAAAAA